MTAEPTEPTDEDVERLARIWPTNYDDCAADVQAAYRGMARKALRSGEVTLAPKPEPEPPKQWRAIGYRTLWAVQDRTPEGNWRTRASFDKEIPDAQQRAEALRDELNGERSSYLVDYDVNLAQWRKRAEEAERKLAEAATAERWGRSHIEHLERRLAEAEGVLDIINGEADVRAPESLAQVRSDEAQPAAESTNLPPGVRRSKVGDHYMLGAGNPIPEGWEPDGWVPWWEGEAVGKVVSVDKAIRPATHRPSDEAQPAEPLFTGTVVFEQGAPDHRYIELDDEDHDKVWEGERYDLYPPPAPARHRPTRSPRCRASARRASAARCS